MNLIYDLIDLFFPNLCHICERKIFRSRFVVCKDCISSLSTLNDGKLQDFFAENFLSKNIISNFYSKYPFEKDGQLQLMIHKLKYNGISKIGIQLGRELGKDLKELDWFNRIDCLVPIPLYRIKEIERGYNQSFMICKGIQEITGIEINKELVRRIKNTKTQTLLTREERQENISNAFKMKNKTSIAGMNIAIVDDVSTTGATSSECALALLRAGASTVSVITLAVAI